eukprot:TRINITY_DN19403_c0_g1_i1.p1 TRINITY_DN19403_c0_g1~~TRINITY_DN19403_c0_g1_i1.p1  ORF type:complete len:104 (-),score=32.40 TRINITY_DN19403_c0_g1_i1:229-540(-)
MLRSLVGSEMCIRDRTRDLARTVNDLKDMGHELNHEVLATDPLFQETTQSIDVAGTETDAGYRDLVKTDEYLQAYNRKVRCIIITVVLGLIVGGVILYFVLKK